MKYCAECSAEFQDTVTTCADCGSPTLLEAKEMQRRNLPLPHELDSRRFIRVATADDPLSAERLVSVLTAAQLPVFARPRRAGSVDAITSASPEWWEILVPEQDAGKAAPLLAAERTRMDAAAEDNARAAEEEALESSPVE